MTKLYEELTMLAERAGLPLAEVAKKAGVPRRTLSNWRNELPRTLQHYVRIMETLEERTRDTPTPPVAPNPPHPPKP